jgi:hypothetical protein
MDPLCILWGHEGGITHVCSLFSVLLLLNC